MPRGRIVKPKVESLIENICIEHPNWKASEIRNTVRSELKANAEYAEFWPIPKDWPSLSKVQKVIAPVREKLRHGNPLDKPWSMLDGVAEGVEVSSEALPYILATWVFMKQAWNQDLSIREARWLDRLYGAAKTILINLGPKASMKAKCAAIERIPRLACVYAATERIAELTDKQIPSVALDFTLWRFLTEQSPTPELLDKLFPDKQQRFFPTQTGLVFKVTKREQALIRRTWGKLGFPISRFGKGFEQLGVSFEIDEP